MVDAQRRDRQFAQPLGQRALGEDAAAVTGEGEGPAAAAGDGALRRQPDARQPAMQIGAQRRLAAEEMRHAGDIAMSPSLPSRATSGA